MKERVRVLGRRPIVMEEALILVLLPDLAQRGPLFDLLVNHQNVYFSAVVWWSNSSDASNHRSISYLASSGWPDACTRFAATTLFSSEYAFKMCAKCPRIEPGADSSRNVLATSPRTLGTRVDSLKCERAGRPHLHEVRRQVEDLLAEPFLKVKVVLLRQFGVHLHHLCPDNLQPSIFETLNEASD